MRFAANAMILRDNFSKLIGNSVRQTFVFQKSAVKIVTTFWCVIETILLRSDYNKARLVQKAGRKTARVGKVAAVVGVASEAAMPILDAVTAREMG